LDERVVRDRLRDRVGAAGEAADAARVRARSRELVDERGADQGIASAKQVVSLQSKYEVLRRPDASRKSPST
jgi:hypothetical protein